MASPDRYTVRILERAKRELAALTPADGRRVAKVIDALAEDPMPARSKALTGELAGYRRARAGDYRIIYRVERAELVVLVVRLGHRREVYR